MKRKSEANSGDKAYEDRVFSVIAVFAILAAVMAVFLFDDSLGIAGRWPAKALLLIAVLVVCVSPLGQWFISEEKSESESATKNTDEMKP